LADVLHESVKAFVIESSEAMQLSDVFEDVQVAEPAVVISTHVPPLF